MRIALIITVLNEAETVLALLQSVLSQTHLPNEVIITDGGSKDETVNLIKTFADHHPKLNLKVLVKPGNRSVGRNWAIQHTAAEWLACTDAGCTLAPTWLAELVSTQQRTQAEVIAGYYQGQAETSWQTAVVPYVLVMPDKLAHFKTAEEVFLPATRSLLMARSAWAAAGYFNETLADNEDYALAHAFLKHNVKMAFAPQAIVFWQPPKTWAAIFRMFYRFARGDAASGLWRPKVTALFIRYLVALIVVSVWLTTGWSFVGWGLVLGLIAYLIWAIAKNQRYVPQAWGWLPGLQLTADAAVMSGSVAGLLSAHRVKP